MKIENSVVLVSGANGGIGQALVAALLANGASKVYAGIRRLDAARLPAVLQDTRVEPLSLDITDPDSVAQAVSRAGDVNLLLNNAGVASFGSVLENPISNIQADMDINYYGTLNLIRGFVPVLEAKPEAAIVNILTLLVLASMPSLGGYSASKAALASLTQSIRGELRSRGIAVMGVYPGAVDTDMIRDVDIPKTSPADVASAVIAGIEQDKEEIFPDPMSLGAHDVWRQNPKELEQQFSSL